MAVIVGINSAGHDTSACIMEDGRLVAAAEEERFSRKKHATDMPVNALKYCLKAAKVTMRDVDVIAIPWLPSKIWRKSFTNCIHEKPSLESAASLLLNLPHPWRWRQSLRLKSEFGELPPLRFFEHHYSHACTAFYCSGMKKAAVLTVDGAGENNCAVGWSGANSALTKVREEPYTNSIGLYYTAITAYLGFVPYWDEGKTMGLAPYGTFSDVVGMNGSLVDPERGAWWWANSRVYTTHDEFRLNVISEALGHPGRGYESALETHYANVAYAAQTALERAMCNSVKDLTDKLSTSDLCLAGGVALNCKANGEVRKQCDLKDFYIFPVANDAGGAVGAALAMASELGELRESKIEHTYWGPEYSNEQIEELLKERKLKYEHCANIEDVCAERLASGRVVGWFQGRMEMGPRALGNRSILADPRRAEMKDIVNGRVKKRESWRPYCPSLLVEAKDEYLVNACDAPFMILSFDVPPEKIKEIPAVVHVDGTTRPQTVRKEINERFWRLIKSFEGISGVPVVLNTSFNLTGEPIVCTPSDALRSFFDSGMDCLALGNFLIEK